MSNVDDIVMVDADDVSLSTVIPSSSSTSSNTNDSSKPDFKPVDPKELVNGKIQTRKVRIPANRFTPLKNNWMKIYTPIVEHLKLQIRMLPKARIVEIRTCKDTEDPSSIQKAADFVKAFSLGFDVDDAAALLRLDELYIESFEIKDVKTLHGDHLARAIGRLAGKDGKTRFTIENASKTRIVLADTRIHILGSFKNIKIARDAISNLILGSPPGKVYANLRTIASRLKERF
ncbi:Pre-rRNA-processing protein PNO1 [Smittium mucronatum]|uniref:Pre-rRNA-processing protein PNO1 n=1 Tax=Smittium mucronatum TaxID=133383 RepID=A0A1R0H534_9FUNG|nr:Pre-rRNA-processing protein PNO1 [Smittium mucronatum]